MEIMRGIFVTKKGKKVVAVERDKTRTGRTKEHQDKEEDIGEEEEDKEVEVDEKND